MISPNPRLPGNTQATAPVRATATRSVLLVDDESTLRSALRRFFIRRGWRVYEAVDGEQARAMLLDTAVVGGGFDVVITDLQMPRLTGMALHELVTRVAPVVSRRFIFSSGDTSNEEVASYLARTHCPVVQKPFELASLLALVERIAADGATQPAN